MLCRVLRLDCAWGLHTVALLKILENVRLSVAESTGKALQGGHASSDPKLQLPRIQGNKFMVDDYGSTAVSSKSSDVQCRTTYFQRNIPL
jgi:hypothetical protein